MIAIVSPSLLCYSFSYCYHYLIIELDHRPYEYINKQRIVVFDSVGLGKNDLDGKWSSVKNYETN